MKEKDYDVSVFIGRFQPLHNAHLNVIKQALEISENLLIVIGSAKVALNIKNPFTYAERKEMILESIHPNDRHRVKFIGVRDYYYNDTLWCAEVQQKTSELIGPDESVALVGSYKDASSYYLKYFPQWDFVPVKQSQQLDATDIREKLFSNAKTELRVDMNSAQSYSAYKPDKSFKRDVPEQISWWLEENYIGTPRHSAHVEEFDYIKQYKKQWGKAPYPPIFVTADAVVSCSGHVFVFERDFNPGKDLYALPGGFIKADERIEDSAIRELKEETAIQIDKVVLKSKIVESKVFDYPNRSLRGRTITHAYHIKLNGDLPKITANSDANRVKWMSIADLYRNEHKFFEDHFSIIQHFITRN